jgi:hypothetical protein
MKTGLLVLSLLAVPGFCARAAAQQVPSGIKYKAVSEPVNAAAKAGLEKALSGAPDFPGDLMNGIFTCGPMLWKDLKPSADKVLLESKEIVIIVATPASTRTEGRGMVKPEQRVSFWNALLKKYPGLKSATVRRANEKELRYYWATIFFDIQEPLFVIDTGSETFIAHFGEFTPSLFWIDRVDDLSKLKDSQ